MPERVLLVRWSGIGDVVMALPAAATIRASKPSASLAWSVDARFRALLDGHRDIERVFAYNRRRFKGRALSPATWGSQLRAYLEPRSFRPNLAVDMQGHAKTALMAAFSGAKRRVGVQPRDALARVLAPQALRVAADRHMIERHLDVMDALGFSRRSYNFGLPITEQDRAFVNELLGGSSRVNRRNFVGPGHGRNLKEEAGSWVTVHLGSGHPKKTWPPEQFAAVARWLHERGNRVVLVGGPEEAPLRQRFLRALGDLPLPMGEGRGEGDVHSLNTRRVEGIKRAIHSLNTRRVEGIERAFAEVEDCVGRLCLLQVAEVLRRSRLHLSNDTGTAHIAAAFGVPCVTVFGHMPPAVFHPFRQPDAVVQAEGDIESVRAETVLAKCRERLEAKV